MCFPQVTRRTWKRWRPRQARCPPVQAGRSERKQSDFRRRAYDADPRRPEGIRRTTRFTVARQRRSPAVVIEDLFEANGWGDTWRDGIY